MIISINQPAYLPWPGYFHRIAAADLHIVLDHVQFEKNSFVNRNRIRTKDGWCWLTVPVRTGGRFGALPINRLEIAPRAGWARKHWESLRLNYAGAPYFRDHAGFLEAAYRRAWSGLLELLDHTNGYLLEALGIGTPLRSSSRLDPQGRGDEMLLDLCRKVGARVYLSGPLGRDYLREELFRRAGIEVRYDDYAAPRYVQAHPGFESHLSVVDLLFNCGDRSLEVLMTGSTGPSAAVR